MCERVNSPRVGLPLEQGLQALDQVGQLNGHALSIGQNPLPRAGGQQGVGASIQRFFSRMLNLLTPNSVRAESKVQIAHHDFSQKLGDGLGELTRQPPRIDRFMATLNALRDEAEPITHRGGDYREILQSHLAQHLREMPADQLQALAKTLKSREFAEARATAMNGPSLQERQLVANLSDLGLVAEPVDLDGAYARRTEDLSALETMVLDEQVSRLQSQELPEVAQQLDQTLQDALDQTPREAEHPGTIAQVFSRAKDLVGNMTDRLVALDVIDWSNRDTARLGLVKEGLARMEPENLTRLLQHIASSDLQALANGRSPFGTDTGSVDQAVKEEITARNNRLHQSFRQQVLALTGAFQDSLKETPSLLVKRLADLDMTRQAVLEHADRFDLATNLEAMNEEVTKYLNTLKPGDIALDQLTPRELRNLSQMLTARGVTQLDQALANEVSRRKETASLGHQAIVGDILQAVKDQNYGALIQHLARWTEQVDATLELYNQFGAGIDDERQIQEFRMELLGKALSKLDTESATILVKAFQAEGMDVFSASLTRLGNSLMESDPEAGKRVLNRAMGFNALFAGLERRLETLGQPIPQPLRAPPTDPVTALPPQARETIYRAFPDLVLAPLANNKELCETLRSNNQWTRSEQAILAQVMTHPSVQAMDRFNQTVFGWLIRGAAPELLSKAHQQDTPLSAADLWQAVMGEPPPQNLTEEGLAQRLLDTVSRRYLEVARHQNPDLRKDIANMQLFTGLNQGLSWQKTTELVNPRTTLRMSDFRIDVTLSSLAEYKLDNAYGQTVDLHRWADPTVFIFQGPESRETGRLDPNHHPRLGERQTAGQDLRLDDPVVQDLLGRLRTLSGGHEPQAQRLSQFLTQASTVVLRMAGEAIGAPLSEHGAYTFTLSPGENGAVNVRIELAPNMPAMGHLTATVLPDGQYQITGLEITKK